MPSKKKQQQGGNGSSSPSPPRRSPSPSGMRSAAASPSLPTPPADAPTTAAQAPAASTTTDAVGDIEDFGSVEVTQRCCGAMTCRVLAPSIFLEAKDASSDAAGAARDNFTTVVGRPIKDETEYRQVRRAVAACPFHAIRLRRGGKGQALEAAEGDVNAAYPFPVSTEGDVLLLGFYSPQNAGASCYLIKRARGGNVMVDAPKPDPALIARIEELGGVEYIVFTHKDHTAFHREWAEAFPGARRVLHSADVCHAKEGEHGFFPYTGDVEVQLAGSAPKPQPLDAEGDVQLIPIPGHTKGSIAVLYRDHYLFTGDSLHWSTPRGHLVSSRVHCWTDWRQQARSLLALVEDLQLPFQHVLPGHGEPMAFGSVAEAHAALRQGVAWMDWQPGGHTSLLRFFPWFNLRTKPGAFPLALAPAWLRGAVEAVLAPVGAPGTYRRGRIYKAIRWLVAFWVLYRVLPRLGRWLRAAATSGRGGGRARHCRLPYGAYLLMGGGTAAAKARAIQSSTPQV